MQKIKPVVEPKRPLSNLSDYRDVNQLKTFMSCRTVTDTHSGTESFWAHVRVTSHLSHKSNDETHPLICIHLWLLAASERGAGGRAHSVHQPKTAIRRSVFRTSRIEPEALTSRRIRWCRNRGTRQRWPRTTRIGRRPSARESAKRAAEREDDARSQTQPGNVDQS